MTNSLYSTPALAAFLLTEASGNRSRENAVVSQTGEAVPSGSVMAASSTIDSTAAFAVVSGATGNPTSGAITVGVTATPGVYNGEFTSATAYKVYDPAGVEVGTGATGTAFNKGGLTFTLAAGATAAVAGDEFTVTVQPTGKKFLPFKVDGSAGEAAGILYTDLKAQTGDVEAVVFVRDCEVNRKALVGLSNEAEADLELAGIIVRGEVGALGISTPAL